jgi:hypothetical protein
VPCAKLVTAPGAQALLGLARSGAVVYASYFAGGSGQHVGPWLPWLGQLFGVEHSLRYGVVDRIEEPTVTFEMVQDLGPLGSGTRLSFTVAGAWPARSFLPVVPAGAEILALDDHDRPALLRNRAGDGWMVLCTYPIEHMAACRPEVNPEPTWQIYAGLAAEAGVEVAVGAPDGRVSVGSLEVGAGTEAARKVYVALNLSGDTVATPFRAPGLSVRLAPPMGGAPAPGPSGGGAQEAGAEDTGAEDTGAEDTGAGEAPAPGAEDTRPVPPPAALVSDELGTELLELGPYQVAVLEASPRPVPVPTEEAGPEVRSRSVRPEGG